MDDVDENIHHYNLSRKSITKNTINNSHIFQIIRTEFWWLVVDDDMIANIMTNKKFQAIIKELFIRYRKLNISLLFITQTYFSAPKDVRLNSKHYLNIKINNKRDIQSILVNHSADIDYQDCMKI